MTVNLRSISLAIFHFLVHRGTDKTGGTLRQSYPVYRLVSKRGAFYHTQQATNNCQSELFMQFQDSKEPVRLDKWLWAARFYKTRALATEAIAGGKVHVDGERVKPSKKIQLENTLEITQADLVKVVIVRRLLEKRGPASVAQTMYEETEQSRSEREAMQAHMKYTRLGLQTDGRPTKKDRRQIRRMKYGD